MPKEITVDLGDEYALLEQEIASKGGVLRRRNTQAVNTLSVSGFKSLRNTSKVPWAISDKPL